MPAAGEKFLKIVSSNMENQRKVARRRRKISEYGTFKSRRVHFLYENSRPLGLNRKGDLTTSKLSKPPPTTFENPKVLPCLCKGGVRDDLDNQL